MEYLKGQQLAQLQAQKEILCYGPQFKFNKHGQSGLEISELFPHFFNDFLAVVAEFAD